jgi:hypothetical protein
VFVVAIVVAMGVVLLSVVDIYFSYFLELLYQLFFQIFICYSTNLIIFGVPGDLPLGTPGGNFGVILGSQEDPGAKRAPGGFLRGRVPGSFLSILGFQEDPRAPQK